MAVRAALGPLLAALLACVLVAFALVASSASPRRSELLSLADADPALEGEPGEIDIGLGCCSVVHWPCCASQACCDKWGEYELSKKLGETAGTATRQVFPRGEPMVVLSEQQLRELMARYAMMRAREMGGPMGGFQRYAARHAQSQEFVAVPVEEMMRH